MIRRLISLAAMLFPLVVSAQQSDPSLFPSMVVKDTISVEIPAPSVSMIPEDYIPAPGAFKKGNGVPVDTLDIGDGFLQIVLNDDYTWRYVKNQSKMEASEVFTDHWLTGVINPYTDVNLAELPYRSSICLVDSVSNFVCPYISRVYSKFGYRRGRRHQGVDLAYPTGTPVKAAFDGRVRLSQRSSSYGNLIILRHENGLETYYAHLSKRNVEVGEWVRAGDIIGLGGSTGRSSGPHLHFETRYQGFAFDPQWIIDFEKGELRKNVFVLRRSYLDASSRYIPSSIDEEEEIYATDEAIIQEEMRIAAEKAAMKWHTVRSGDTVSAIAKKYGKSQSAIVKLNPGLKVDKISIGQKIRVN